MDWIRENWFWLVVAVVFFWMHGRMHGGHGRHAERGGHGGHAGHGGNDGCCGPPAGDAPLDDPTGKEERHAQH